jgi:hypothetical protein
MYNTCRQQIADGSIDSFPYVQSIMEFSKGRFLITQGAREFSRASCSAVPLVHDAQPLDPLRPSESFHVATVWYKNPKRLQRCALWRGSSGGRNLDRVARTESRLQRAAKMGPPHYTPSCSVLARLPVVTAGGTRQAGSTSTTTV